MTQITFEAARLNRIKKFIDDLWFGNELEAINEIFTNQSLIESPISRTWGAQGKLEVWQAWAQAFPKRRSIVRDFSIENYKIFFEWDSECVHEGIFMGFKPTGLNFSYGGICIFQLDDQMQVSQYHCYSNVLEVIAKSGLAVSIDPGQKDDIEIVKRLQRIGKTNLTKREVHILVLWGCFYSAKESAERLGISHRTVEGYRSLILSKTELSDSRSLFELIRAEGKMELIHYLEGARLENLVPGRYRGIRRIN